MMTYIYIGAAVLAAAFFVWLFSAGRRNAARRAALKKVGVALACDLEEYGPDTMLLDGTSLPFFLEARKGVGRNLMRFTDDPACEARFFDYAYMTAGERKGECTVALFDFKKDLFPGFYLSGDGSGGQPQLAGFEVVDVKNVPGLPESAKFYATDAARASELLRGGKAGVIAEEPSWNIQGGGSWLLLYKPGQITAPGSYHTYIAAAKKLAWRLSA